MNWIGKAMFWVTGIFILFAFIGIGRNLQVKVNEMPGDIKYQIVTFDNTWPDQFYCADYINLGTGFRLETYWTLEIGKYPLASSKWVYHPETLTWANVDSVIREIKR